MDSKRGRELHGKAEHAREKEQDFLKALKHTDEAIVAYIEDNDYLGLAEVLSIRFSTFKHLHQETKDEAYMVLAVASARTAVEIARRNEDKTARAIPLLNLGKAYEEFHDWENAVKYFKDALSAMRDFPPERHNRPAVMSDIEAHLGFVEFMNGDKKGMERLDKAIDELEENTAEHTYTHDVWLSGAYMRKAKALKDKPALQKAKEIIDKNKELVLRKRQWEALSELLAS